MEFLKSIGVEDREYTQDEIDDIVIDALVGHLMSYGWKPGPDYEETNEIGRMCEAVIDAIEEQRRCTNFETCFRRDVQTFVF